MLAFTVHHFHQCLIIDVSQFIFGENEVVARIYITVEFHNTGVSASFCHRTYSRLFTHPVCQSGVEYLYVVVAYVFFHPFVKKSTQEIAPLLRSDGEIGQFSFLVFGKRGEMPSVLMRKNTFDDRGKLYIMTIYLFEKVIEVQRIVSVKVIDNGHCIPFYIVFFQQIDTLHHFHEGRFAHFVFTVFVMKLLWSVDGNSYQPVVVVKEPAPFIGEHCSVRLNTVVDGTSASIFLLQFHSLFIERKRAHQCFSPVPGEKHLWHGL